MSFALSAQPRARKIILASAAVAAIAGSAGACSPPSNPQTIARNMLFQFGWGNNQQYSCLDSLWTRESGWRVNAMNPYSGAYGIPQAHPGGKMSTAGPDWQTSAQTQIRWGLSYIGGTYGSPCGAWSHSLSYGWY